MHHFLLKGTHRGRRRCNRFVFYKHYVHSTIGLGRTGVLPTFLLFLTCYIWPCASQVLSFRPLRRVRVLSLVNIPIFPGALTYFNLFGVILPISLLPADFLHAPTTPNCPSYLHLLLQPSPSMPPPPPAGSPRPPLSPLHCSQEDVKSLTAHIVENYWKALEDVDYVQTFKGLKLRYEQQRERQDNPKLDR